MTALRRGIATMSIFTVLTGSAWADGNADNGRALAIKHCARCHAVPGHNPHGGIGSTPSFKVLTYLGDYVIRMQTFFDRRPHRAFVRLEGIEQDAPDEVYATPILLKLEDVDDLVAYVRRIESN